MDEAARWLWLAGETAVWCLLGLSLVTDLWRGAVYNWLTLPAMVLGLILAGLRFGVDGLISSSLGLVIGGGVFLLPFLLGAVGGGDVKLMAALGSLVGPVLVLKTALYACLVGGAVALVMLAWRGGLGRNLRDLAAFFTALVVPGQRPAAPRSLGLPPIPFAACIAVGFVWARYWDLLARWA